MRLVEHFIIFPQQVDKFNNKGAQIIDSIYHMTLKASFHNVTIISKPLVVY